jgi:hypothetical protein
MATHKAKVVGPFEVCGVAPGGAVEIDDERVNLAALVNAELVELAPEPEAPKAKRTKGGA